ncbi:MAG: hypothetical protein K9M45_09240 [Kiritimatiellales bacterium]|nr:hypothetical protein [Kiritimatiellales bacterium]
MNDFIKAYAKFEIRLREMMVAVCGNMCGMCTACCCRADICEEACDSAFLQLLLKRQGFTEFDFDDHYGWLETAGCRLEYGRPPVCYEYFCDELIEAMPDDHFRETMRRAGLLIDDIGRNALGDIHLTEIRNPTDLEQVSVERLFQRLEKANVELTEIFQSLEKGLQGLE